ncbi:MAG: hypothetical protein CM15mP44_6830 [Candidatus Neomarinimicrobiota bacterium]|nr:MAG: hypothetical protein CM15mP44_6830 [Candidatus Neomarinimicrobiota bacterium]
MKRKTQKNNLSKKNDILKNENELESFEPVINKDFGKAYKKGILLI